MNYKTAIIILTPVALLQALMLKPISALYIFLFAVVLYILLSFKFPTHQHRFSVKISILMFLGFYLYSVHQLNQNYDRGAQLESYLKIYYQKYGQFPTNLDVLGENSSSKIPMVRRGLIDIPFDYVSDTKDSFVFSMNSSLWKGRCYWATYNGWDCPD